MFKAIANFKLSITKLLLSAFFFFLGWLITELSKNSPAFATESMQPLASDLFQTLSSVFSFTSFSCAEILLYLMIVGFFIGFVATIIALLSSTRKLTRLLSFVSSFTLVASFLFLVFECLYGFNYYSESKTRTLGLNVRKHSPRELEDVCTILAQNANQLADSFSYPIHVPTNEEFNEMASDVAKIVSEYTHIRQLPPKRILLSVPMCYTQLTGVFSPFTGEANVNAADLTLPMPFTMAHEMMHRWGVNPEDEANLFAFISLYECSDNEYRYSASFMGLLYTLPQLRKVDKAAYDRVTSIMALPVKKHINAYNAHWEPYEGETAQFASKVNNSFLQYHGETEGVASYGKVVDWLLAYFDKLK